MLYVYAIQQRHAAPEMYLPSFYAATKCQAQITSIATPGSLAQRYGVVLQELRLELLRYNNHLLTLTTAHRDGTARGPSMYLEGDDLVYGPGAGAQFGDPSSMLPLDGSNPAAATLGLPGGGGGGNMAGLTDETLGFTEGSPGSSIVQMAGWGQFDSLVSGVKIYLF